MCISQKKKKKKEEKRKEKKKKKKTFNFKMENIIGLAASPTSGVSELAGVSQILTNWNALDFSQKKLKVMCVEVLFCFLFFFNYVPHQMYFLVKIVIIHLNSIFS